MPFTPVEFTVITQDVHGVGEQAGTLIPWPAGATNIDATALLSDADVQDPTKTVTLTIIESFDGGQTTQRGPMAVISCGTRTRDGTAWQLPSIGAGYGTSQNFPTHSSANLALSAPLSVGLKIKFS